MKITQNKNPDHRFDGTVTNDAEGRAFIANMRKLGLKVEVYGRHSNRKALVGKVVGYGGHTKSLRELGSNGRIPLKHAEYLSVTVFSKDQPKKPQYTYRKPEMTVDDVVEKMKKYINDSDDDLMNAILNDEEKQSVRYGDAMALIEQATAKIFSK